MTAALLVLLIAQPTPEEPTRVLQRLGTQLGEANRLMQDDPEGALRQLNALLDDPRGLELEGRSPSIRVYREYALYSRCRLQLQKGQAQAVADEMTTLVDRKKERFLARSAGLVGALASPAQHAPLSAVLRVPPADPLSRMDRLQALSLRAEAYKNLGQHDKEQADRAEVMEILRELMQGMPPSPFQPIDSSSRWLAWIPSDPQRFVSWATGPLFVVAGFVVMAPIFFLMGLRQRRDAGGTWRRLFCVSLALAALQTAPTLAAFLLLRWWPRVFDVPALPFVTLLVFAINVFRHRSYLTAVKWTQAREAPPLLDDPLVLARIAQIAGRLGIATPVTRLVRSPSALQLNTALVAGLAAPTVVLYDGILYRLAEEERDAIIAHELAHLANHTFWYWLVVGAVCAIAVVVASAFYPLLVAVGLGLALLTGTWLCLSRWLELDCDRRAARAIGHRRVASALWKIHADQPFRGLIEFLIGAVSTHPSRDERLAAIRRDAPNDDRPEIEWDSRLLWLRRLAGWGAIGMWVSVVVVCLVWGRRWPGSNWPALPLVLMVVALFVLFWLGFRKQGRQQRRLQRTGSRWRGWLAWLMPALLIGFLVIQGFGLAQPYLSPVASLAILAGGVLLWLVTSLLLGRDRTTTLNLQIVIAIQSNDFPKALALAEGSPALVAGSTVLRYNLALIRALLGRREEALSELEQIRRDDPHFKMTWLLLVSIYTDEGEYARALELTTQLSRDLPRETAGPLIESWLLRKVGRLEEADARAREVLKKDPHSGLAHLTLAAVAFDRGDHAAAREQVSQAERLVPGSVDTALLTAEMALATDNAGAEAAVRQAVIAVKNNPLSFREKEVARLVARLEANRWVAPSPPAELGEGESSPPQLEGQENTCRRE